LQIDVIINLPKKLLGNGSDVFVPKLTLFKDVFEVGDKIPGGREKGYLKISTCFLND